MKDVKLRDTPLYQFATSASQRLTIWSLEPATGAIEGENIPTGSYIRHYISFCFSKPRQEFLFGGTLSGDFVSFQMKHKMIVFVQNVCA